MKNLILPVLACLLLTLPVQAQPRTAQLDIQLNKNILQPGDSLLVTVDYTDDKGPVLDPPLATLEVIIENEQGSRTRLRWPMINAQARGALYLPDTLSPGRYKLLAGLQNSFLEVKGQVRNDDKTRSIRAMLLTKSGAWDEQEIPVMPDGSFSIGNWVFVDNALLAFSGADNNDQPLDIRINSAWEASDTLLAVAGRSFYVGNPSAAVRQNLAQPIDPAPSTFSGQARVLPAVLVRTTVKTPGQQFNDEYVTGLFRSGNERMISIMDDRSATGMYNIFSYLQGRVAGLQITQAGFGSGAARWRGSAVTFFLDEVKASAEQVASIPMSDIAIVKLFPPPFAGAAGSGGAIAIYTRRGNEANYLPAHRKVFKVRGFTPYATSLEMRR